MVLLLFIGWFAMAGTIAKHTEGRRQRHGKPRWPWLGRPVYHVEMVLNKSSDGHQNVWSSVQPLSERCHLVTSSTYWQNWRPFLQSRISAAWITSYSLFVIGWECNSSWQRWLWYSCRLCGYICDLWNVTRRRRRTTCNCIQCTKTQQNTFQDLQEKWD